MLDIQRLFVYDPVMPRKKPDPGVLFEPPTEGMPDKPSKAYTSRELWRFVRYYCEKIRNHPQNECVGVIRNIQRMIDKGIGLEKIATALENYYKDEWRTANPAYSMKIRSFFSQEAIEEWQHPRPKVKKVEPRIPSIDFTPQQRPKPAVVLPRPEEDTSDL